MAKQASLPFKGDFQHIQSFGANPDSYARYGINGHDGDDWRMPSGTPLYSPVTGKIIKHGNDPNGWGIYVHVWDPNQKLVINIAHFSGLQAITGAEVKKGQRIGFSGNTGNSSEPHVHIAAADTDSAGNKTNTGNGFRGWYSILDSGKIALVSLGDTAPAPPQPTPDPIDVEGQGLPWAEIFKLYYAGWDETAALADFNITMEGDLDKLLVARGLKPGDIGVEEKPRPTPPAQTYWIKPKWVGKSLKQIAQETGTPVRLDILSGWIAIPENEPIEATRQFNTSGFPDFFDVGSGEVQFFNKYFWTTQPPGEKVILLPAPIGGVPEQPEDEELGVPPEVDEGTPGDAPEDLPPEAPPGAPPPSDAIAEILVLLNQILAGQADILDKLGAPPAEPPGAPPPPSEQTAAVFIETTPRRASIYIDDQWQADYTPSNSSHLLAPGEHTIRLKKKGYKDYKETIDLTRGQTLEMTIELEPA